MGISFIGPSWLAFSFLYCKKKLARPVWLVLFGLALLHYMVFLTNERHHLFYRQFEVEAVVYGRMFYVHMAYTYCCVAGGMGAVLREFWKKRVAAVHLAVILLSAAVPLAFNVLYLSGWAKTSFDLTPLAFSLSGFPDLQAFPSLFQKYLLRRFQASHLLPCCSKQSSLSYYIQPHPLR